MSDLKTCTKCGVEKELSEFYKKKGGEDRIAACKLCINGLMKEYNLRNKVKIAERGKKYYQKNHEKAKEAAKDRYRKNPRKAKEYQKEYRKNNVNEVAEKAKKYWETYYEPNKEIILKRAKKRSDGLSDGYIISQLRQRTSIKIIPTELIELKRVQLQIKRHLKETK